MLKTPLEINISPKQYLASRGLVIDSFYSEWISIQCPAHKGGTEKNPSLRVNLKKGCFRCMACNVSGGDLISLHRLMTGRSFREALQDLGVRS